MRRLGRSIRNAAIGLWVLVCVATFAIWVVGELSLMRSPQHVVGRWSCWFRTYGWKIIVAIYHDDAAPNVGPRMDPGPAYNPAVLAWYQKTIPSPHYHKTWGFDFDEFPSLEINRARNMVLVGHVFELRMPDWTAVGLWLSFAIVWFHRRRRRNLVRRGYCGMCLYDLTANISGVCPECGTAVTPAIQN